MKILVRLSFMLLSYSLTNACADELVQANSTLNKFLSINTKQSCPLADPTAETPEPSFCENTYHEVCENPEVAAKLEKNDQERQQFYTNHLAAFKAMDRNFKSITKLRSSIGDGDSKQDKKKYSQIADTQEKSMQKITEIETAIYKFRHLDQKDIDALIEEIKKDLIEELKTHPEFHEKDATKFAAYQRRIKQLKIITASSIKSDSDDFSHSVESFMAGCGFDGLLPSAFYNDDDTSNTLLICPGFILNRLSGEKNDFKQLAYAIAHEIGHSIDPDADFAKTKNKNQYTKFLQCINTNYADQLNTMKEGMDQLNQRGIPILEKEAERLSKIIPANPANAIRLADVDRIIDRSYRKASDLKMKLEANDREKIDSNNKALSHDRELTSDLMGSYALAALLEKTPSHQKLSLVTKNLSLFCDSKSNGDIFEMQWGKYTDGLHPSQKFRMEEVMRNPSIRKQLGCTPLKPTDKPWCEISGEKR